MNKIKSRLSMIMIAVLAMLGLGALSTPASAYSMQGCLAPKTVWVNGYWKGMQQYCYINYNWYEEIFSNAKDGYKLTYSWTENTISGAKYNFRTHVVKYG